MKIKYILFIILGYISGSILYAYLIPKCVCGIDITDLSEDRNPGTANAFIYAGSGIGIFVLFLELAKGFVPVYMAKELLSKSEILFSAVMISPVAGHAVPLFEKGKGGKCIGVSFGVLLGLYPELTPVVMLAAIYIFFSLILVIKPHLTRSIVTFLTFAILIFFFYEEVSVKLGCLLLSAIVIIQHMHRKNGEKSKITLFGKLEI